MIAHVWTDPVKGADGYHVIPIDDLVAHEPSGECICGPEPVRVLTGTGDGWNFSHWALDGRE